MRTEAKAREVSADVLGEGAGRLFNILSSQVNIVAIHGCRAIIAPARPVAADWWILSEAILR